MKTYNILLIDDEKEVCESLIDFANQIGIAKFDADIIITDRQSWQDGAELLEKEYFHALILDARCMIETDQVDDNFDFLTIALERLKEIEQKQDRHIPFVINTGYFGEKEVQMMQRLITERRGKIFSKTLPKDEMFQYLVSEIEISENTKIEKEYADVFEIFDKGYLDATFRAHLLKLLKTSNSDEPTEIKKNLALLRSLQEQIFQTLNKKDNQIVPDKAAKPKVRFWEVQKQLSGNLVNISSDRFNKDFQPTTEVFQNDSIKNLSECIYKIASDDGSHNPYENTPLPNKYTVQSLKFAFLEQLIWFKKLMKP